MGKGKKKKEKSKSQRIILGSIQPGLVPALFCEIFLLQTVSNVCLRDNKKALICSGLLGVCLVLGMCYPDYVHACLSVDVNQNYGFKSPYNNPDTNLSFLQKTTYLAAHFSHFLEHFSFKNVFCT